MGYLVHPLQLPLYIPVLISCIIICAVLAAFALAVMRRQQTWFRQSLDFHNRHIRLLAEERRRIAKELHDAVNPQMHLVLMLLETIKEEHPLQSADLDEAALLVRESLLHLRQAIKDMNDEKMMRLGLQQSLEQLIERYRHTRQERPDISFSYHVQYQLPPLIINHVYHIVQELFYNTLQHAAASCITIKLRQRKKMLYLYYADDGRGFNNARSNDGMGAKNISDRTSQLGGTLRQHSKNGVIYFIAIPLLR